MANILFITQSLGFGGASKILSFVAESLDARHHQVCIVNLKGTKDVTHFERTFEKSILIKDCSALSRVRQIQEIRKFAKENDVDIIIGFTQIPNALARIVGKTLGIPSIMSERGDPIQTGMGVGFKNRLVLKIINSSSGGVFQTEGAKAFYGEGLQKRGIVIPNPIFIKERIEPVDFEYRNKTVVSVGRLDNYQKRYDVMLEAFRLFSEKHPEYVLKLYGKGTDEELIRNWTIEKGIRKKVQFMGLSTNPMADIARAGMFLITSDFEGISNSLLEAMAVGLPCVSTEHAPGGARLLIQHEENGLLAPVGDAKGIAEAMARFVMDTELAHKCGENAKCVVERFAPSKITDMWETYILKLISK